MFLKVCENQVYTKTYKPIQKFFEEHFFDPIGNSMPVCNHVVDQDVTQDVPRVKQIYKKVIMLLRMKLLLS